MPVLGRRPKPRFGMKARAQQAAIASRQAADAGKTFTTIRASTGSERLVELRKLFPIGSRWRLNSTFMEVIVVDHAFDGLSIVIRRADGKTFALNPHEMRISDWERLDA